MTTHKFNDPDLLRNLFDAIPSLILAVDEELRVLEYNEAAEKFLGIKKEDILKVRGGEALHCFNSGKGCGKSEACKMCPIREAAGQAFAGNRCIRRRVRMEVLSEGKVRQLYLLITASPFDYKGKKAVILVLEDVRDLVELQQLVPICAWCKKVRDDDAYWKQVESYLSHHLDMQFTHGICPDCAKSKMEE